MSSISYLQPRRNATVNMGTTVFARHDLGGGSSGCPAGKVGAIRRFKRIASVLGERLSQSRAVPSVFGLP
jgi:hypothetical protein